MITDTLLLATFCKARDVKETIDLIATEFEVVGGKIFVLQDESDRYKKILTYNIVKEEIVFSNVINKSPEVIFIRFNSFLVSKIAKSLSSMSISV